MSVANKEASGQPNNDAGGGDLEPGSKDMVSYDTYSKTVSEVKKLKLKLSELSSKETERESTLLAEQGKWKEAAEAAAKKSKELQEKVSEKDKVFAKKVFNAELRASANRFGIIPEILDDLPKLGDWSKVEIDDEFNIDKASLDAALSELVKAKPFLTKKSVATPKDVNTTMSGGAQSKIDISKLSQAEVAELLKGMN